MLVIPLACMHTWPQISKKDADCFVPGQWIPECELVVEWREQKQPTRLWHEVFLTGAKAPGNYFNLVLDPTEGSYIYMSAYFKLRYLPMWSYWY